MCGNSGAYAHVGMYAGVARVYGVGVMRLVASHPALTHATKNLAECSLAAGSTCRIMGFMHNMRSRTPRCVAGVRLMACMAGEDLILPTAVVAEAKAVQE